MAGLLYGRLAPTLFTLLTVPLLVGLSFYDGFEDTFTIKDDIRETFIAYAVSFTASAVMLLLFGIINIGLRAGKFRAARRAFLY